MYPLLLSPVIKDYLWGGQKLKTEFNKQFDKVVLAESWELACHKDGFSVISNGKLSGFTLQKYIESDKENILGTKCNGFQDLPVLVKLIDANKNLSIQVHPDNEYALKYEGQFGKTEMWYIIDCEPDSYIYYGFSRDLTPEEFLEKIKNNTILEVLNAVKVKKGDVFFIESGTLHAICKGIVLAEVQQNSNITYRIYDYNRLGTNGKPRELHINKAVDVTNIKKQTIHNINYETEETESYTKKLLIKCEFFTTYNIIVENEINLYTTGESFHCLLCLNGNLTIHSNATDVLLEKGQTVFIPANLGNYKLIGNGEILFITL